MKAIIIGGGVISEAHAEAYINKGVEILAVVDPNRAAREACMARFSIPRGFETLEEALTLKPDVASVCTPNHLHMPQAIACLEAGVNVITEKPMARTAEECDKMIEAAERTGKKLFVGHSQRFNPFHQELIRTVRAGELGKSVMAVSTFYGNEYDRMNAPQNWKGDHEHSGGGVLIDNGAHMIDLLQAMYGPARYVEAVCDKRIIEPEHKAEDTASVLLTFENGMTASLTVTFVARACPFPQVFRGAAIRTEIIGEKASVLASNGNPSFIFTDNGKTVRREYHTAEEIPVSLPTSAVEHFLDCLRTGSEPFVTMYDGRRAVRTIEAAYRAAECGHRVEVTG